MEKLLKPKEIADLLSVSVKTVYKWVGAGFMPHHKISGAVRFKESAIEIWLKRKEEKGRLTYKISV